MTWFDADGQMLRYIPLRAIDECTEPGQDASDVVRYWVNELEFEGPPNQIRAHLRGYGAWDDEELADHEENLHRLFWIVCGHLRARLWEEQDGICLDNC